MGSVLVAGDRSSLQPGTLECLAERGCHWCELDPLKVAVEARRIAPLAAVLITPEHAALPVPIIETLRGVPELRGLPILTVSDPHDPDAASKALAAGANDWLPSDTSASLLQARLASMEARRQMQLRLALNQRMAQIGQLATGIVHEIRGPLSVIGGNAELLLMSLLPETPALQFAEPILRTVRVLQKRLEHLMGAVRTGSPQFAPVALPELIHEASLVFQRGTDPRRARIKVAIDLPIELPPVRADAGRILLVLLNLLSNAHEATANTDRDTEIQIRANTTDEAGSRWVVVEIQDNGPGIPDEARSRIFEPFFTTKVEGTGYGLYLSNEILHDHGGRIDVAQTSENGTVFALWLPVTEADEVRPDSADASDTPSHR